MKVKFSKIEKTESETLKTFQRENPSQYFSHSKKRSVYLNYSKMMEKIYTDDFKLPKKVFYNSEIIDFGAGTGDNTLHFANWGAKCTLVEMNSIAVKIAKKIFNKYAKNKNKHRFFHSSIFDFKGKKKYDIVKCTGVLSHTAAKEKAFAKIAQLVKPGGFLHFGDQTKSGEFQNMLQRHALYKFTQDPERMVEICEYLFKNDIDRSQKAVPRTRRAIIFDRWVIQQQDDPSIKEVMSWAKKFKLKLYSTFPPISNQLTGDSRYYQRKTDLNDFTNFFSISELIWMMHTDPDEKFLKKINTDLGKFSSSLETLISYVSNISTKSRIKNKKFNYLTNNLQSEFSKLKMMKNVEFKLNLFLKEAKMFLKIVNEKQDLKKIKKFIDSTKYLFRGTCGNKNLDFVFIKK